MHTVKEINISDWKVKTQAPKLNIGSIKSSFGSIGFAFFDESLCCLIFNESDDLDIVTAKTSQYVQSRWPNSQISQTTKLSKSFSQPLLDTIYGQFTEPLNLLLVGTPFQRRVWKALLSIPYGTTCSYQSIAEQVDCPGGARAVGTAIGANPLAIIVPCHRVISKSSLGGYAWGLHLKQLLLSFENAQVTG